MVGSFIKVSGMIYRKVRIKAICLGNSERRKRKNSLLMWYI